MKFKQIVLVLFLFAFRQSIAAENLEKVDYIGVWNSDWAAINGEEQELIITSDLSSTFKRKFENGNNQKYESENADLLDDILFIKYENSEGLLAYKLIVSGWKTRTLKKIYGTMYMYQEGKQFNGVPVSFIQKIEK